jgi:hypothetical protein
MARPQKNDALERLTTMDRQAAEISIMGQYDSILQVRSLKNRRVRMTSKTRVQHVDGIAFLSA